MRGKWEKRIVCLAFWMAREQNANLEMERSNFCIIRHVGIPKHDDNCLIFHHQQVRLDDILSEVAWNFFGFPLAKLMINMPCPQLVVEFHDNSVLYQFIVTYDFPRQYQLNISKVTILRFKTLLSWHRKAPCQHDIGLFRCQREQRRGGHFRIEHAERRKWMCNATEQVYGGNVIVGVTSIPAAENQEPIGA